MQGVISKCDPMNRRAGPGTCERDGLLKMCDLAGCPHEMTRAPRLVLRNLEKYVPEPSLWGTETRGIY